VNSLTKAIAKGACPGFVRASKAAVNDRETTEPRPTIGRRDVVVLLTHSLPDNTADNEDSPFLKKDDELL
jgi:hypothetical protein